MTCPVCTGELERRPSVHTISRSNYHLMIYELPLWLCRQWASPRWKRRLNSTKQSCRTSYRAQMWVDVGNPSRRRGLCEPPERGGRARR